MVSSSSTAGGIVSGVLYTATALDSVSSSISLSTGITQEHIITTTSVTALTSNNVANLDQEHTVSSINCISNVTATVSSLGQEVFLGSFDILAVSASTSGSLVEVIGAVLEATDCISYSTCKDAADGNELPLYEKILLPITKTTTFNVKRSGKRGRYIQSLGLNKDNITDTFALQYAELTLEEVAIIEAFFNTNSPATQIKHVAPNSLEVACSNPSTWNITNPSLYNLSFSMEGKKLFL